MYVILFSLWVKHCTKPDREKLRKDIMNLLGIDDTYYKSKYKEPVSDFPSDSNQIFAKEMQSIFR